MPIRALLFDFGGTLDAPGVPWKERFLALFRAEGVDVAREAFYRAYYAADDPLVDRADGHAAYGEVVRELACGLARALGTADPDLTGARVAARFLSASRAEIERSKAVLRRLRGRYRVGILSNFYGNLASACRETGLDEVVDVALDSEQVGARKPDPAFFRRALEALGVSASEAVMVGDSRPRDVEGARGVGMGWLLLVPAGATVPDDLPPERVIRSLDEVEERVA